MGLLHECSLFDWKDVGLLHVCSLFDWNVVGWPFLYLTGLLLDGLFFIWLECCWMAFSLFDWNVVGWPFLYLTGMLVDGLFFIWLECCWMAFSRNQRCPPPQSINKEKPFNQKLRTCLNPNSAWTTRQASCSVFIPLQPKVGSILFYLGLFITPHLGYMLCLLNFSYSFKIVT